MSTNSFEGLALNPEIISALSEAGYEEPTEIQAASIPIALEGKDVLATAKTGTGKTAAFSLPILEILNSRLEEEKQENKKRKIKALILSPTRELAQQIEESIKVYGKNLPFKATSVVGGLPIQRQINRLKKGIDILVATPGRLLDLYDRRAVDLRAVSFFVLDEADRMLDMGFVHDVRKIERAISKDRQTFLFSATISSDVKQLSNVLLKDPQEIAVSPPQAVADNLEQKVYYVERKNKRNLAIELLKDPAVERAIVFTMTKDSANILALLLEKQGINANAIHSDKDQRQRQKALKRFDEGTTKVLVATDVMARGIDVDGVTHVINYELPNDPENYVHRIGRTARAGSSGIALALCDLHEVALMRAIEEFTKQTLEVDDEHQYHAEFIQTMKNQANFSVSRGKRGGGGGSRRGGGGFSGRGRGRGRSGGGGGRKGSGNNRNRRGGGGGGGRGRGRGKKR